MKVLEIFSEEQKADLELRHRYKHDGRIHEETVRQHLTDWASYAKLKPENGGSSSKLDDVQTRT